MVDRLAVALAAWRAAPPPVPMLYAFTASDAARVPFGPFGSLEWPPGALRGLYEAQPSYLLAASAMASSACARHGVGRPEAEVSAWMRYAGYCDQALRLRLGVAPPGVTRGLAVRVIDGMVRIDHDAHEVYGGWVYVGLATESVCGAVKATRWPRWPGPDATPYDLKQWVRLCRSTADGLGCRPTEGHAAAMWDAGLVPGVKAIERVNDGSEKRPAQVARAAEVVGLFD